MAPGIRTEQGFRDPRPWVITLKRRSSGGLHEAGTWRPIPLSQTKQAEDPRLNCHWPEEGRAAVRSVPEQGVALMTDQTGEEGGQRKKSVNRLHEIRLDSSRPKCPLLRILSMTRLGAHERGSKGLSAGGKPPAPLEACGVAHPLPHADNTRASADLAAEGLASAAARPARPGSPARGAPAFKLGGESVRILDSAVTRSLTRGRSCRARRVANCAQGQPASRWPGQLRRPMRMFIRGRPRASSLQVRYLGLGQPAAAPGFALQRKNGSLPALQRL